tara:strand:+ start:51558 stop:51749 length:192 start_codon:yes stop_codon:yes gene_type:complete
MLPADAKFLSDRPAIGNHRIVRRLRILEIIECLSKRQGETERQNSDCCTQRWLCISPEIRVQQ